MSQQDTSASERISAALEQLRPATQGVTNAADQLARSISTVERTLKTMNVAFEAWVTYREAGDDDNVDHWDVGYSRVNGHWGICIQTVHGSARYPEDTDVKRWHFNEAPLYLRPQAVPKIPDVLEALVKTAPNVEKKILAASEQAARIAQAVTKSKK